jgi:hypothetical protein
MSTRLALVLTAGAAVRHTVAGEAADLAVAADRDDTKRRLKRYSYHHSALLSAFIQRVLRASRGMAMSKTIMPIT